MQHYELPIYMYILVRTYVHFNCMVVEPGASYIIQYIHSSMCTEDLEHRYSINYCCGPDSLNTTISASY